MLPCIYSVIDHRRCQKAVRTSVTHSPNCSCTSVLFLPHFYLTCESFISEQMHSNMESNIDQVGNVMAQCSTLHSESRWSGLGTSPYQSHFVVLGHSTLISIASLQAGVYMALVEYWGEVWGFHITPLLSPLTNWYTSNFTLTCSSEELVRIYKFTCIYLPISRTIFSEIWTCIDQKHSQQRGSSYGREFDWFCSSLRCWELMGMSRKFCDRLVAKVTSVKHNKS